MDFALTFPEVRSAQDAANVAATLKQAGWRVDQGELEKAVGFTLEKDSSWSSELEFEKGKLHSPTPPPPPTPTQNSNSNSPLQLPLTPRL